MKYAKNRTMRQSKARSEFTATDTGFTIVELLVTIFVISIGVAAISDVFISTHAIQHRALYTDEATRAAQSEIETLRNSPTELLQSTAGAPYSPTCTPPSSLPASSTCAATITFVSAYLWGIQVTLTYPLGGSPHVTTLNALVGALAVA